MPDRTTPTGDTDPLADEKDSAEAKLARQLAKLLREQFQLLSAMSAEQMQSLSQSYWDDNAALFLALLVPALQGMASESAVYSTSVLPGGVAYDDIAEEIANWAGQHAGELVRDINAASQRVIGKAVQDFFSTPGMDVEALVERLKPMFGPTRAESIAVTETTRAYAHGAEAVSQKLREQGIEVEDVWETVNDNLVCEICMPNHGKRRSDGWTVPSILKSHPRCRCFYSHVWVAAE